MSYPIANTLSIAPDIAILLTAVVLFIVKTQVYKKDLDAKLEAGTNQLLELNSFKKNVADDIIASVNMHHNLYEYTS